MNSSAQPTASAHSSSRMKPSTTVLLASQKTKPCQTRPSSTTAATAAEHGQPDPQRDPADLAAAGDELGGAGQDQRHQQQRDGAAEPDAGQRGSARSRRTGARAGAPTRGKRRVACWAFRRRLRRSSITSHTVTAGRRRAGRVGRRARRGRAGSVPSPAMADRPRRDPEGADEPGYDWLYGTRRKGVGGVRRPAGADDATRVQPRSSRGPAPPRPRADPDAAHRRPPAAPARAAARAPLRAARCETPPPARRAPRPRASRASPAAVRPLARPTPLPARLAQGRAGALAGVPRSRCRCSPGPRSTRSTPTPSGDRPADAARDDVPPGRQRQPRGPDPQAAAGVRRRQGRGPPHRHDHAAAHRRPGPNLLMSIPRDSIVDVPGHGTTKINAAFAFGGPKLLVKTIEQNTGIRVDDYVEIGFARVRRRGRRRRRHRDLPQAGDEGPAGQPRHREGLPGGRRHRRRSATPAPGTPPASATSTAPSTSARWSAPSATKAASPWTVDQPGPLLPARDGRLGLAARRRGHRR